MYKATYILHVSCLRFCTDTKGGLWGDKRGEEWSHIRLLVEVYECKEESMSKSHIIFFFCECHYLVLYLVLLLLSCFVLFYFFPNLSKIQTVCITDQQHLLESFICFSLLYTMLCAQNKNRYDMLSAGIFIIFPFLISLWVRKRIFEAIYVAVSVSDPLYDPSMN